MSKLVFVLGAGASKPYGFPLGAELTREIYALVKSSSRVNQAVEQGLGQRNEIKAFVYIFKYSACDSIDNFLSRLPQFSEIGRRAIASIIMEKEKQATLFDPPLADQHWYQYFINAIDEAVTIEELRLDRFAIVTFNYDRSFEAFLAEAISNRYVVPIERALDKLAEMPIVHVYGSLGSMDHRRGDYFAYGGGSPDPLRVHAAAERLRVIPEGRNDDAELKRARQLLLEADTIAFLGFGFDPQNLARLDSKKTCSVVRMHGETGRTLRRIVASTMGQSARRLNWISTMLLNPAAQWHSSNEVDYTDGSALKTLQEQIVIGNGF